MDIENKIYTLREELQHHNYHYLLHYKFYLKFINYEFVL